jgi:ATP-dependent RNA helicase DHX57
VLILCHFTGKTTQIPQYILEDSPGDAKIVVAQPRRLAATGVADRVAHERGEPKPGIGTVGYVVRGDTKMSDQCRLMFCTTGVLLRQLQSEGALDCVTHIVIDEVHERHLDTDVLLAVLKETRPRHLRVVLMSATMDADRFAAYWGHQTPRLHIPGFTYPVKDYFLDDVLRITRYIPPKNGKKRNLKSTRVQASRSEMNEWNDSDNSEEVEVKEGGIPTEQFATLSLSIDELVKRVDSSNIDYDMVATLVSHLVQTKDKDDDGSILVFLPGAPEIDRAHDTILRMTKGKNMNILPLHGGLQPHEQKKVFDSSTYGMTKVILSTNVAETSITIPDCTIVIDTAREKQSSYDPSNRMPLLIEKYASQDSLKQRRGRAGRVRPGSCYKVS